MGVNYSFGQKLVHDAGSNPANPLLLTVKMLEDREMALGAILSQGLTFVPAMFQSYFI